MAKKKASGLMAQIKTQLEAERKKHNEAVREVLFQRRVNEIQRMELEKKIDQLAKINEQLMIAVLTTRGEYDVQTGCAEVKIEKGALKDAPRYRLMISKTEDGGVTLKAELQEDKEEDHDPHCD